MSEKDGLNEDGGCAIEGAPFVAFTPHERPRTPSE
jgi:hypothetical protein